MVITLSVCGPPGDHTLKNRGIKILAETVLLVAEDSNSVELTLSVCLTPRMGVRFQALLIRAKPELVEWNDVARGFPDTGASHSGLGPEKTASEFLSETGRRPLKRSLRVLVSGFCFRFEQTRVCPGSGSQIMHFKTPAHCRDSESHFANTPSCSCRPVRCLGPVRSWSILNSCTRRRVSKVPQLQLWSHNTSRKRK